MKGDITKVLRGAKFRKELLKGVDLVSDAVGSTMGNFGRNLLIERRVHVVPVVTNDGKRVAKAINPKDPVQRMAVRALEDAASNTDLKSGDGTTGTVVLAQAIIHEAFDRIGITDEVIKVTQDKNVKQVSVVKLRQEINETKERVLKSLEKKRIKIKSLEDLEKVAITSVEDNELGKVIAGMVKKVGEDGHVFAEEGFNFKTETEIIEGMKFGGKLAANFMINNPNRMEAELRDVKVIVTNHTVKSAANFVRNSNGDSIFGDISVKERQIVVMGWKFEKQFLIDVANMWRRKNFQIYCVKVPSLLTEQLKDIATWVGAGMVDENQNMKLSDLAPTDLGTLKKIVINAEETILVGGGGSKRDINRRIKEIKEQIKIEKLPEFKKKLAGRIASLASGVGIIKVGFDSQTEQIYVLDKIQDSVLSTKEALKEGTVKGGGLPLKEIAEKLPKDNILKEPLQACYKKIQENAGEEFKIPDGVIDSYSVIRAQVENACSVASVLIMASGGIYEEQDITLDEMKGEIVKLAERVGGERMPEDPALDR